MDEDKAKLKITGIFKAFKGIKNIELILSVCIIAVILLIAFGGNKSKTETKVEVTSDIADENLEVKLETVLATIKSAGNVKVLITYESTNEIVPAYNNQKQTTKSEDKEVDGSSQTNESSNDSSVPVTINNDGNTEALILTEKMPEIRGVIIVAEGAGSVNVRLNLLRAAQTVLNITADKVEVFEMNK